MPNHVVTEIRFKAPQARIDEVREAMRGEHPPGGGERPIFDFETIYPVPPSVKEAVEDGQDTYQKQVNVSRYGFATWYDFQSALWGTKWNAYEGEEISPTTIRFQTAWSCPIPVIRALAIRYPDVTLHVRYADEDIGSNFGAFKIENGILEVLPTPENQSKKARLFAYDVRGYTPEEVAEYEEDYADDQE